MPPSSEERRPPITPQMAVRVAVLGGFAFVLFAIIFFRLWFLQVLSGEDYVSQARENRVRKVRIEAPRGDIVDRNNTTLVKTKQAAVVQITPTALPDAELQAAEVYRKGVAQAEKDRLAAAAQLRTLERRSRLTRRERRQRKRLSRAADEARPVPIPPIPAQVSDLRRTFRQLGRVLEIKPRTIHRRVIEGIAEAPYSNVTIKTDVSRAAFGYLQERKERFPGVVVETQYLRDYPHKDLGAQLFGSLGEITPKELKEEEYRGVAAGTRVGQNGIEESYDSYLRGNDGFTRVVINALGSRDDRRSTSRRDPIQGQTVKLTLDLGLQQAAHNAMRRAIGAANGNGNPAKAGAYVAMDPTDGSVLALGSYPSFDANLFAKPISQSTFEKLNSEERGAPLYNRAIAGTYPTGSIFKPVTAVAALESGVYRLGEIINDDGKFELGPQTFKNAKDAVFGPLEMVKGLEVSSDVFFYTLGARMNSEGPVLQSWARKLGLGRRTGIDIPGEIPGLVPDRRWRDEGFAAYRKCVRRKHVPAQTLEAVAKCGGIERPWSTGDNVNLAVGQGDLQATPLQMAVAYSAIANGGKVVRPHLGMSVEDGAGRTVEEIHRTPRRRVKIATGDRDAIMKGLFEAANAPDGTSSDVFKGFGSSRLKVYGKTGTAERGPGQSDQSWYAAYVPHPKRPIVVIVTIEKGGFGAETAAPAARLILSKWFDLGQGEFRQGSDQSR
jgi:penicillin-binding protein 2